MEKNDIGEEKAMKRGRLVKNIAIFVGICMFISCSAPKKRPKVDAYEALYRSLKKEEEKVVKLRSMERQHMEKLSRKKTIPLTPVLPSYNPLKKVPISLNVINEPLDKILYIIARNAGLNLIIEPDLTLKNNVTISFENTPSSVVIQKLLSAYDLAWSVKDNCLYVKRYEERIFNLDFLNVDTQVSIKSGGDIFGSSGAESGGNNFTGDFSLSTSAGKGSDSNSLYGYVKKNIEEIIKGGEKGQGAKCIIDPVTGTMYVKASPSKMRVVEKFLQNLKARLKKQVIIDARILEISLNKSFQLGIDWNYVLDTLLRHGNISVNLTHPVAFPVNTTGTTTPTPTELIISSKTPSTTIDATIHALSTFGTVTTISNPHLRTRHGQPALIISGTTKTYVKEITSDGNETSYNTATAFEGVMLGVIPYITDKNNVDLQIFPISSDVDLTQSTPTGLTLPVVDVRNVNTNVRVKSGDTIILGGLIYRKKNNDKSHTPALAKIPVLGWLFKQKNTSSSLKELVIIMHVKVI